VVDDLGLVQAAQGGDRAALDQLLRRHYDRVFGVCRRITGNDADAADAAQEALLAIVRGLTKFDGRSSIGTWIYRIATNASLDELRRRRRRPMLRSGHDGHDSDGGASVPVGRYDDLADDDSSIQIEMVADRMAIDAALGELQDDFRLPVVLRDVGSLDYAEIAEILDVPVGTVKSRIARGRAALVTALQRSGALVDPIAVSGQASASESAHRETSSSGNRDGGGERQTSRPSASAAPSAPHTPPRE
jgi:RNA polymerase sigma-70 factor, ECF subfamily